MLFRWSDSYNLRRYPKAAHRLFQDLRPHSGCPVFRHTGTLPSYSSFLLPGLFLSQSQFLFPYFLSRSFPSRPAPLSPFQPFPSLRSLFPYFLFWSFLSRPVLLFPLPRSPFPQSLLFPLLRFPSRKTPPFPLSLIRMMFPSHHFPFQMPLLSQLPLPLMTFPLPACFLSGLRHLLPHAHLPAVLSYSRRLP